MTSRDEEEQDLRIQQMTINIEKMNADMRLEARKYRLFVIGVAVSAVSAAAALLATGVAIGRFVVFRQ